MLPVVDCYYILCYKTSFHTCKRATFSSVALFYTQRSSAFTRRPSAVKTCDYRAINVRLSAVLLAGTGGKLEVPTTAVTRSAGCGNDRKEEVKQ